MKDPCKFFPGCACHEEAQGVTIISFVGVKSEFFCDYFSLKEEEINTCLIGFKLIISHKIFPIFSGMDKKSQCLLTD